LKAHQAFADNPTVFAAMNMGVIILEFYRILVFRKNEPKKLLGLAFALVSIVLIALSNLRLDCFSGVLF
jgi:hypothetical protein